MPELPEVETVRAGLAHLALGHRIIDVEVSHPRAIRRHLAGADDLRARLVGSVFDSAQRRGKYLWLPLHPSPPDGATIPAPDALPAEALVAHLGMSGQLLVRPSTAPDDRHVHVRMRFDDGSELRFADQRTFGGVFVDDLVRTDRGDLVPAQVAHIARDPLDPAFDDEAFLIRLRHKESGIKRALLDQTLVSGIGNIYADEALWRARLHGDRPGRSLTRARAVELLAQVRAVLADALRAGGTSFDSLYVNVNGDSGYFDRSLAVYGREGQACPRCGTRIRRVPFMNRSSYFCPRCQRMPALAARGGAAVVGRRPGSGKAGKKGSFTP
jgi:formamidopyrimidine-DNA glycosylase